MRDGWIILETFTTDLEAQGALSRLESFGLQGVIEVDNCGGMRPHFDYTIGVKLLVPEEDAAKARDLMQSDTAPADKNPWLCNGCGENIEAGFDACRKCGQDRN